MSEKKLSDETMTVVSELITEVSFLLGYAMGMAGNCDEVQRAKGDLKGAFERRDQWIKKLEEFRDRQRQDYHGDQSHEGE